MRTSVKQRAFVRSLTRAPAGVTQTASTVLVRYGKSYAITARIKAQDILCTVAVDPNANQVYVANLRSASVTVIPPGVPKTAATAPPAPRFRVIALAWQVAGDHQKFVDAAHLVLDRMASQNNFAVDYITNTDRLISKRLRPTFA